MVNKLETILDVTTIVNGVALNKAVRQVNTAMSGLQKREAGPGRRVTKRSKAFRDVMQQGLDVGRAAQNLREQRVVDRAQVGQWNVQGMRGFGAAMKGMESNVMSKASMENSMKAADNMFSGMEAKQKQYERSFVASNKRMSNYAEDAAKHQTNMVKKEQDRMAANAKKSSQTIKNAFSAAFSLHIITQFVSPFLNQIQMIMKQTISEFAEFDKYYADYIAKSTDFTSTLSRSDIFALQAGNVYGINDVASAMERFSASGIDVTKNTKAVTDVLQVATVAQIDYKDASNAVIKTMEAFHLNVNKSTMIVDAMTAAANASTAELKDMVDWFEFAAGSAYQAGLEVRDLSAYLGILSSAGLKNVGTSFRQFLVQFQKADVREKFATKFGFATEDFRDMNKIIETMRGYVQGSSNATAAAEELTQMLGGKVNAMQALQQLLLAQPALWNRLQTAVNETGVTAELYKNATDNAAHSIERIQNTIQSFYAQIGGAFAPVLKLIANVLGAVSTGLTNMPGIFKMALGAAVVLAGALTALGMTLVTLVSLMAVMQGATQLFASEEFNLKISTQALINTFIEFKMVLTGHSAVLRQAGMSTDGLTAKNEALAASNAAINKSAKAMAVGMGVAMTAMMGFSYISKLAREDAYELAYAVTLLTAALVGLQVFSGLGGFTALKAGSYLGAGAGLAAFGGVAAYGGSTINRARMENNAEAAAGRMTTAGSSGLTNIYVGDVLIESDDELGTLMVERFSGEV